MPSASRTVLKKNDRVGSPMISALRRLKGKHGFFLNSVLQINTNSKISKDDNISALYKIHCAEWDNHALSVTNNVINF